MPGGLILVGHGKSVDFSSPFAAHPFGTRGETIGAEGAGMVAEIAAITTFLDVELVTLERLPEGAAFLVDVRERFGVALFFLFLWHRIYRSRRSLIGQNQGGARMAGPECTAGAVDQGDLAILDLARTAFGAQLFDCLDHEEDPAHPGMIR